MASTNDDEDDDRPGTSRVRYPFISLSEALERVKVLYKHFQRAEFTDGDAIEAMGVMHSTGTVWPMGRRSLKALGAALSDGPRS